MKPWVRRASTEGAETRQSDPTEMSESEYEKWFVTSENTNKRDGFKDPELKLIKASRELGHHQWAVTTVTWDHIMQS